MAKIKVRWSRKGYSQYHRLPETGRLLLERAQQIADRCNQQAGFSGDDCYVADVQTTLVRNVAMVKTNGPRSSRDNAKHNRILKNLRA